MRLKLPAYGKRLLEERRGGNHPLEVTLVYGDKWWDFEQPKLCIKPDEFEPGKYDFRVLAGLRVEVFDEFGAAFNADDKFFDLMREVGEFAALVWISWPDAFKTLPKNLRDIAWDRRVPNVETKRYEWPRWWSDEIERGIAQRFDGWFDDAMAVNKSPIAERVRAA